MLAEPVLRPPTPQAMEGKMKSAKRSNLLVYLCKWQIKGYCKCRVNLEISYWGENTCSMMLWCHEGASAAMALEGWRACASSPCGLQDGRMSSVYLHSWSLTQWWKWGGGVLSSTWCGHGPFPLGEGVRDVVDVSGQTVGKIWPNSRCDEAWREDNLE